MFEAKHPEVDPGPAFRSKAGLAFYLAIRLLRLLPHCFVFRWQGKWSVGFHPLLAVRSLVKVAGYCYEKYYARQLRHPIADRMKSSTPI